ncbi:Rne/Rng family ribonuclease [Phenylobacterium sp.]|uniref:Rne/Rng family ribonuclease n=1 Tax=Phenylobacterium sp. TaxID=1871053 RepID=UPI002C114834|nr:Rne/Rng family ribonuclease [Phenylobacterium sp.]HLZ77061.1 Rne/Rng family ribonuclease [Phenylobacterium sp.]
MSKNMLIDAAHAEETRVVVVDGTRVEEFDFESSNRKQLRGNIYLAKVTRVEPSLQAAFIEYGGNRHGFLAFNEIHPDYYQIPVADREALMREEAEEEDDHHEPRGRRRPAEASEGGSDDEDEDHDAASEDDDDDVMEEEVARRRRRLMRKYKIQEVIRRRQIMLVQVVKEERGNKGAALTTYLSLAGRYGVLMPNTARGGGISRKIETATDRRRLKGIVQSLDVPQGMGLIVRTAGAKRTKAELKRDYDYLLRLWENIRETTLHSIAPALIYEEEDLVKRAIRDLYDKDIDGVFVEGAAGFKEARDFMRMLMPSQAKKVQLYAEPTPLFVKHRVEDHLSQIYSPVVPLRSGGYLVINQTEALVAVDVNSGKSTRERNIEATALKTNMEAAEEAARQLRLRDLAGLIVIDFIDMDESKNNRAVEKKLKDCLKDDRARVQMGKISAFGLMEISRQRRRSGVLEGTTHVCEHCQGTGRVRSVESSALAALRTLELEALKGGGEATLKTPRAVGLYILNEKRAHLARLQQTMGLFVTVMVDDDMAHADCLIERTSMEQRPDHAAIAAPTAAYAPMVDDGYDDEAFEDEEEEEEEEELEREDTDDDEPHARAEQRPRRDDESEEGEGHRSRGRRRRRGRRDGEPREPREAGAAAPRPAEGPRDDSEGGEGRRRRRGRRGGRRMRDDSRPVDAFSWVRPWVPYGDDPFVWYDPSEDMKKAQEPRPANDMPAREEREQPRVAAEAAAPAPTTLARAEGSDEDVWVELPAAEDRPARARRGRGRGRGRGGDAQPSDQAVAEAPTAAPEPDAAVEPEPAPEPVAEAAPPAKKPRASRAKTKPAAAEAATEAAPEPVAAPEAPAPAPAPARKPVAAKPREPDPAEITTPPAAPRKGWWRRG